MVKGVKRTFFKYISNTIVHFFSTIVVDHNSDKISIVLNMFNRAKALADQVNLALQIMSQQSEHYSANLMRK